MTTQKRPRVLLVIPARGGSKGIPRKNLANVAGTPLVARSIMAAKAANLVDDIVVSTDDPEIASVARDYGAEVVERPADLSSDTASSESALVHAADTRSAAGHPAEIIVLLQCTAPFTTAKDIDGTIRPIVEGQADSCFAATEFSHFLWSEDEDGGATPINHEGGRRTRRQDLKPQYLEAGSVYAMRLETLRAEGHRFCGRTRMHIVDPNHVFEIDTPEELRRAQLIAHEIDAAEHRVKLPDPIHAIVFDFDGIFTDNTVYVEEDGREFVRCSRSDGMGIAQLRKAGIPMLVLSTERNPVVEARCRKLQLPTIQGVDDKLTALKGWLAEQRADPKHTIYVGNDINDLECLEYVGCGVGPADSHAELIGSLALRLTEVGGGGTIRSLSNKILKNYDSA